ncbi:Jerky protein [Trichinella papuae]|uniref:Jerky protein n=1 Tax=Trichinella papuae TaxID=268474 RepID=A0A0V1MHN1_9BILA|nr:Jerky protein [Trichinella papuae]
MSGMSTTRKVLNLEQKLEMCRLVESFGVGLSTISDIYRSRLQLSLHMNTSSCCSSRKSMKKASNSALDSAVYMWFFQKRALDQTISSPILQEKTLDFSTKNFKSWHDIRELKIHGEKLCADSENAAKFTGTLNDLIRKEGYNVDLEYNADETSLVWKYLPETSLVSMTEKTASGFNHRLTLLLVGKSKRPRAMIGVQKLPVVYDYQTKLITERQIMSHNKQNVYYSASN